MEKPLVLVADDSESTCTLIVAVLQKDFTVDVARDGREAIEKTKRTKYAAVVLDLLMPETDGFDVLDHLGVHAPELLSRVVVVTATISERHHSRARSAGVHAILQKPFEVDALHAAVVDAAGGSHGQFPGNPLLTGGMFLALAELLGRVR